MRTKNGCWWLMVLLVFAVTACGEKPTEPELAGPDPMAAFAKDRGKPGGGGKPSGDIQLSVTIDGEEGNGILPDEGGPYIDKVDLVSAVIRDSNGMLYFQTFAGKRNQSALRGVAVKLGPPLEAESLTDDDLANLKAFADEVGFTGDVTQDWPTFTSDVTLHTRSLNGGMIEMGDRLLDAGKIAFNDYGDASWEWRLLFGARVETPEGGVDHYEEGLCVNRDGDSWVVTNYGPDCDFGGITELWRVVDGDFTHVADFSTPMHLTLRELERL